MHLENLTFCNLREEDLRFITDQHVVKLFRVAQLIIEYLLHAQEQLSSNLNSLAAKYAAKKRFLSSLSFLSESHLISFRSLINKRKELEELQENSKMLRAQLRSKKKGIQTLETLLKDASTREHQSRSRRKGKERSTDPTPTPIPAPVAQDLPLKKPPFTKIYVSGPNGWCIEFNKRNTDTISELKKEVKQAFVNKKDLDEEYGPDPTINLLYQGRVLLNDSAIEDIDDLKYGDTIVAHIEKVKQKRGNEEMKVQVDPRGNALDSKEMMEFITRQHEISSNEMRYRTNDLTD
jgi:lysyl-tRNA synthetase class II